MLTIYRMNTDNFLQLLRKTDGWNEMMERGMAGSVVRYKGVDFWIYRDDASHFLRVVPSNQFQLDVVDEFNELINLCRKEIQSEMCQWNLKRLNRDDNECDPIM